MTNIKKIEEAEQKLNSFLVKIILGFSFLADSKDEITFFFKKHIKEIYKHLLEQYKKAKEYYKAFKTRHKNYTKK